MNNSIKICGIKNTQNINFIELLKPYFIGFILYSYSLRFIGAIFPLESHIKKVGIIIMNTLEKILKNIQIYAIDFIQLHGNENLKSCEELYKNNVCFIKVYRVHKAYAFSYMHKYTNYSIFSLLDTYCLEYGGSGSKFSWDKISDYTYDISYFLSGGIEIKDVESIKNIFHTKFFGIDLNSRFEIEPGNKNRDELRRFIHKINL